MQDCMPAMPSTCHTTHVPPTAHHHSPSHSSHHHTQHNSPLTDNSITLPPPSYNIPILRHSATSSPHSHHSTTPSSLPRYSQLSTSPPRYKEFTNLPSQREHQYQHRQARNAQILRENLYEAQRSHHHHPNELSSSPPAPRFFEPSQTPPPQPSLLPPPIKTCTPSLYTTHITLVLSYLSSQQSSLLTALSSHVTTDPTLVPEYNRAKRIYEKTRAFVKAWYGRKERELRERKGMMGWVEEVRARWEVGQERRERLGELEEAWGRVRDAREGVWRVDVGLMEVGV